MAFTYFPACSATFDASTLDRTAPRWLKILIDTDGDGDLEDVTSYADFKHGVIGGGNSQNRLGVFTKKYRISLRNSDQTFSEGDYANAVCALEAKMGTNGEYVRFFTGYISNYGARRVKKSLVEDTVSLDFQDASQKLGNRTLGKSTIYVGYDICTPSSPSSSLFHTVAAEMGVTGDAVLTATIGHTKEYLFMEEGKNAWKELQTLTAQYAGFMGFRYDGKLMFDSRHQDGWTEPVSEWSFDYDTNENVYNWDGLVNEVLCNRCTTEINVYNITEQRVIHKNVTDYDGNTGKTSITVAATSYWPGPNAADKAQLKYKDPETGESYVMGIEIQTPTVGTWDSGNDIEVDTGTLNIISFNGSTSATRQNADSSEIILYNPGGSPVTINKLELRGKGIYTTRTETVEDVDASVTNDWDYVDKKLPGKYGVNASQAHGSTQWWVEYGKIARKGFGVRTDFIPQVQEGARVTFRPDATLNVDCYIDAYTHRCVGAYPRWRTELQLREYAAFTVTGDADVITDENQNPAYEKFKRIVTYDDHIDGYADTLSGATTTPTQVTITRCESYHKAVVLEWDRQLALTNLDHYEVQVSENNTDWYSLEFDGTDWKDTLDGATDVAGEFLVHSDIPHSGTTESPLGRRLYYRVRRVTKDDSNGTWSSVSNATTLTIENGDLAANTVLANNIQAGAITARELTFGVDKNSISVNEDEDLTDIDAVLIDLSQPDCAASDGKRPETGKEIVYAQPVTIDEMGREYRGFHSPRMIGLSEAIFAERTNIIESPEDMTDSSNWATADCDVILSSQFYDGKRFSRVESTANGDAYISQTVAVTDVTTPAFQATLRKGSGNGSSQLSFYDSTAVALRGRIDVDWGTLAVTATGGASHLESAWLDSETVWVAAAAGSVITADVNQIRYAPDANNATGDYGLATALQVEDEPYASPYIDRFRWPTGVRPAVSPQYDVTMPEKFVFKVKIRPWFTYDMTTGNRVFAWTVDGDHQFIIYYSSFQDKYFCWWQDGGTIRILNTEQFDDGSSYDDINSEIILYGQIDLSTQTGNNKFFAIVGGSKQTEDTDWGGTPDTLTSSIVDLAIGHGGAGAPTSFADSLIEYAKFWTWDGSDLGTLSDETDIDRVTVDLDELFFWEGEDYSSTRYRPVSRQGAVGIFQATENLVSDPEDLTTANWTDLNANITDTLSDYYIDGKRFTKLYITDANSALMAQTVAVTTATPSFQAIFKRGNSAISRLMINETTGGAAGQKGYVSINWSTKTVSVTTATNLEYEWITNDTVWIAATAAGVDCGETIKLYVYPDVNEANEQYAYVTEIQVEDIAYPTPYTPTSRANDGQLDYPFEMPEKFTVMFWARPWFTYNSNRYARFLEWNIDNNHRFMIYYDASTDKITIYWVDGAMVRTLVSQQFDDGSAHDNFNQWLFIAAAIDLTTGDTSGSLYRVYADTINEDDTWNGNIEAKSSSFPTMSVGQEGGSGQAESFISDLMILPGQLLSAQAMDEHYFKNRPWVSIGELASFNKNVRIDRHGVRLHNAELSVTDWRNRQILISNRDGLMAKDAAGTIIHDIPNSPILADMVYGGHIIWKESADYISSIVSLDYTDAETSRSVYSANANVDLSDHIPNDLTNAKGILVHVTHLHYGAANKIAADTTFTSASRYGTGYDATLTGKFNFIVRQRQAGFPAGILHRQYTGSHALIPVVYNNSVPYITWNAQMDFGGMSANSGNYYVWVLVYLLGVLV